MLGHLTKINIPSKHLTKILSFILLALSFSKICTADSIQLTTYYPAPVGAYDRVSLIPQITLPTPCNIGSLMVEQSTSHLLYCHNVGGVGTWGPISQVWTTSGNNVYPTVTDTNPLIFASIGTSAPNFKLTLDNDGGILALGTFGSGIITSYPSIAVNQNAPAQARFIWYPRKAAFRAIWDRWGVTDDTKMGNYSIGFGDTPTVTGTASTVSGLFNSITGDYSTIAGGKNNSINGNYSTITGGQTNIITGDYSVISGANNQITGNHNTIGGGLNNIASGIGLTIAGGFRNTITGDSPAYSTISGGELNTITSASYAVIGGGYQNNINHEGHYATIGGGQGNIVTALYSFIGGGNANTANGNYCVIGGGQANTANGAWSVIAGGHHNGTDNNYSVVLGGEDNKAQGISSVIIGGTSNEITGNYSMIAGGDNNSVEGHYSWAGGRYMHLRDTANQTFVWGYSDTPINITASDAFILAPGTDGAGHTNPKLGINEPNPNAILSINLQSNSTNDLLMLTSINGALAGNIFIIKNNGYVGISNNNPQYPLQIGNFPGPTGILTTGGVWTTPSSRKYKSNIKPLTSQEAIETIQKLNPVTYNYKIDKTDNHVGFIAEDVPDLVAEKGRKGLTAMPVTAVLTAVLKKQKHDIEQGQNELNILKEQLRNLDKQFNAKMIK